MESKKAINSITPTLCRLMGVDVPASLDALSLEEVVSYAEDRKVVCCEKVLVFCPDAIGSFLFDKYPDDFRWVQENAPLKCKLQSVFPSFTPVCFASMFTGLMPQQHGINKYEKPILQCETLFDILVKHGKKVAIVAVKDSSIDRIFRGRPIDYYSEEYDAEAVVKAMELLSEDEHDFILVYNQAYDDRLHETSPESNEAMEAFRQNTRNFEILADAFHTAWGNYSRAILFAPDHGAHYNPEKKMGVHGTDLPEDMQVNHFFGLYSS